MKYSVNIFSFILLFALLILTSCSEGPTGPEFLSYNWPTSSPEEQGMSAHLLAEALAQGENRGFVDCIPVIKNGFIVARRYYNGFNKNTPHNVKSVSKSFLSAMIRTALRDGYLENLNLKMLVFFPEYVYPSIDLRKYDITIRNLLMMQAGIDNDDNLYQPYSLFSQLHNNNYRAAASL